MKLLNKAPFKRGDVVKVVNKGYWTCFTEDTYIVLKCGMLYGVWTVKINDGKGFGWYADRFVKVSEENNSETVERR